MRHHQLPHYYCDCDDYCPVTRGMAAGQTVACHSAQPTCGDRCILQGQELHIDIPTPPVIQTISHHDWSHAVSTCAPAHAQKLRSCRMQYVTPEPSVGAVHYMH